MVVRWKLVGALLVLAAPAWSQEDDTSLTARCQVGNAEVSVELRDTGDGLGSRTIHVVRKGQPDLEVKFGEAAARHLVAPPPGGKSACDKTLAAAMGDTLIVALSEEGHPANPFLVVFAYSAIRHEIGWRRHEPDQDRISPDAPRKQVMTGKDGFCVPTRLVGEAETGLCVEDCGKTHGAKISIAHSALTFDVYRCLKVSGDSAALSVDADRTWKGVWPELKTAFGTREGFERAFGWNGSGYSLTRAITARLTDGRVCALPSVEDKMPDDPESWICPGGKRGK